MHNERDCEIRERLLRIMIDWLGVNAEAKIAENWRERNAQALETLKALPEPLNAELRNLIGSLQGHIESTRIQWDRPENG